MGATSVAQWQRTHPVNAGDVSLIPEWERSRGEGDGSPHQYSWLENPMDRGAWQAVVHGVREG